MNKRLKQSFYFLWWSWCNYMYVWNQGDGSFMYVNVPKNTWLGTCIYKYCNGWFFFFTFHICISISFLKKKVSYKQLYFLVIFKNLIWKKFIYTNFQFWSFKIWQEKKYSKKNETHFIIGKKFEKINKIWSFVSDYSFFQFFIEI